MLSASSSLLSFASTSLALWIGISIISQSRSRMLNDTVFLSDWKDSSMHDRT